MEPIIAEATAPIVEVTAANFMEEVITASQTEAVIVQFWAPWCEPCKQLGPILEKVVAATKNVRLAKVNIDENQQIAAQMRVQSVPTVYGIVNGQPVDGFAGAQPESAVRQFVEKLAAAAPGAVDIEPLLQAGTAALADGDTQEALAAYQQALAARPESAEALAGLVRCLVQMGELDEAAEILQGLDEDRAAAPALREAAAALDMARKSGDSNADLAPLAAAVAANPQDLQAKQDYALALFADGQQEQAMDQLLDSIRQDRDWQEGAARQQLLEFFSAIGHASPLVASARATLSSILFS